MDKVGVMAAYSDPFCGCVRVWFTVYEGTPSYTVPSYTMNYTHAQRLRICCHNTDLAHVNGHDRIILAFFSQALYKAP